jgi:hypothetical protein
MPNAPPSALSNMTAWQPSTSTRRRCGKEPNLDCDHEEPGREIYRPTRTAMGPLAPLRIASPERLRKYACPPTAVIPFSAAVSGYRRRDGPSLSVVWVRGRGGRMRAALASLGGRRSGSAWLAGGYLAWRPFRPLLHTRWHPRWHGD